MINKEMLYTAIEQVATNEVGRLQGVSGNNATVVVGDQVYPGMRLARVFDTGDFDVECPVDGSVTYKPFDWNDYVGSDVLISLIGQDRSNGVVVGVLM